ncbi:MAG: cytochrome-c oxidase, cbb3-type subunit III [Rickettsiales bacterium]|nr:cytochrome-c oxidase, cbb3-type subunit III [Rickettsiales bacterium]
MTEHKDKDELSGVDTTGHEWDGIKELNNPLPRWWLWVFYITIIWSIGYWVVYPAWPTLSGEGERGGTVGSFEWTQYKKLKDEQAEIIARRSSYLERFHHAPFDEIANDPELYAFAIAGGKASFKDNCATCHGTGGAGAPGYPNLNDDDWIWGGDVESIYETIKYGIRMHDDARDSMMPAYAEMLSAEEIEAVAEYVLGLHDGSSKVTISDIDETQLSNLSAGARIFKEQCATCHGNDGKGMRELGAPNLADAIWLKSKDSSKEAIIDQIRYPKHGMMPAWVNRLDEDTLRQLSIYVHSLGGGE